MSFEDEQPQAPQGGGGDEGPRDERPGQSAGPGGFGDRRPRRRGRRGRGGGMGLPQGPQRFPQQPFRPGPRVPPREPDSEQTRDLAAYERREEQQQRRTQWRTGGFGGPRPAGGFGAPRPGGGFGTGGGRPGGPFRGAARDGQRLAGYQEQVRRVTAGPRTHLAPSHDAGEPIAGPHAVIEAIRSGRAIRKLYVQQERGTRTGAVQELINEAQQRRIFVNYIDKLDLSRLSPAVDHQGVVAIVEGRTGVDLDELLLHLDATAEPALVLVLDSLQDPQNFGVLLRSAEGAGVAGVVIPHHRSVGLTAAVARTSAGASEHLLVADVPNLRQAIDALKEKGVWVVGTDETGDLLYDEVDYRGPTAIVIGGEGEGIRRLVLEGCDQVVRIPMAGQVKSLNAAAAGTIVLYEALRQRSRDVAPPETRTPRPVVAEPVATPEASESGDAVEVWADDQDQDLAEPSETPAGEAPAALEADEADPVAEADDLEEAVAEENVEAEASPPKKRGPRKTSTKPPRSRKSAE